MDLESFRSAFLQVFNTISDGDNRGIKLEWPSNRGSEQYSNGYIYLLRMMHHGAPELLRETVFGLFDNHKFTSCAQVRFLLDIAELVKNPKTDDQYTYVPDYIPKLDIWDPSLMKGILERVISQKNESLMNLLIICQRNNSKRYLAEMFLYYFYPDDVLWRRYWLQLLQRSKKASASKREWELTYDDFIVQLLAIVDSQSNRRGEEKSFYGKKIKKIFTPEEVTVMVRRYVSALKIRCQKHGFDSHDKYAVMRLWDFHPMIPETITELFTQLFRDLKDVPMNIDSHDFRDLFFYCEKFTDETKQRIIAELYRKVRNEERFDELAKKLSRELGQKNFQKFQLMKS